MAPDGSNTTNKHGEAFPLTRWSLVMHAGRESSDHRIRALEELLTVYRPLLEQHLTRHMLIKPHRAEDLLQGFLMRKILNENALAKADSGQGRFRSFLLKSLTNYVISEFRKEKAKKRGPDESHFANIHEYPDLVVSESDMEADFNAAWARQVLAEVFSRAEEECERKGRHKVWDILECRILRPAIEGIEPMSYEELVARLGLESPSHAFNLLTTAKRMFQRVLTEVIRDTVSDEAEVEAEIRDLRRALAAGRRIYPARFSGSRAE